MVEKGILLNINVFEYLLLKLYRIFRGGIERLYFYVDFKYVNMRNLL